MTVFDLLPGTVDAMAPIAPEIHDAANDLKVPGYEFIGSVPDRSRRSGMSLTGIEVLAAGGDGDDWFGGGRCWANGSEAGPAGNGGSAGVAGFSWDSVVWRRRRLLGFTG